MTKLINVGPTFIPEYRLECQNFDILVYLGFYGHFYSTSQKQYNGGNSKFNSLTSRSKQTLSFRFLVINVLVVLKKTEIFCEIIRV